MKTHCTHESSKISPSTVRHASWVLACVLSLLLRRARPFPAHMMATGRSVPQYFTQDGRTRRWLDLTWMEDKRMVFWMDQRQSTSQGKKVISRCFERIWGEQTSALLLCRGRGGWTFRGVVCVCVRSFLTPRVCCVETRQGMRLRGDNC